jgi:cardiolipin synthase
MFFNTIPNYLTLMRILIIPLIIAGMFTETILGVYVAFTLYCSACITDFIDGYIARIYKQTSILGRFLDPIADKLLVGTVFVASVALHQISLLNSIAVLIILAREIFISGLREFLADYQMTIPVSWLGRIKTTLQMLSIGFIIMGPVTPEFWNIGVIGIILLWGAAIATLASGVLYTQLALRKLYKKTR